MNLPLDQTLLQALEAHRMGQMATAEALYRTILMVEPGHPDANHNLGVLLSAGGDPAAALPFLQAALRANPSHGQFWISYLRVLLDAGRPAEAARLLEQGKGLGLAGEAVASIERELTGRTPDPTEIEAVVERFSAGDLATAGERAEALTQRFPDHAFGWKALGAVRHELGQLPEALAAKRRAVELDPQDSEGHGNLGVTLRDLGRADQAEDSFHEAIALDPDNLAARNNLGALLKDLGRAAEAEAQYREIIRLDPANALAHSNLGVVLMDQGRLAEAEACYREAIRLKPGTAIAHNNLGNSLRDQGRLAEAEAAFAEAIRLQPDYPEAHNNLGNLLRDLGRLQEAETQYRESIRLRPDLAEAHSNLGNIVRDLGRFVEAIGCYRQALRLKPDLAEAHSNLGVALKDLGRLDEAHTHYREALRLKPAYAEAHSNLLFSLNYAASLSPQAALEEARRYGERVSARAQPKFTAWPAEAQPERLRVGLVSGDLRTHPVGYFVEGLVRELDPARFELLAFPTTTKSDPLTARLRPRFTSWLSLYGLSDLEAAGLIHRQGIHVLLDLSGHTAGNRLPVFSHRPAPVQASWLGYFATTGLPEMDYVIGDPQMAPEGEARAFTETLWNLPKTWLCLARPEGSPSVRPLPALGNGRVTFGAFGNLSKMNDGVVALWARVLRAVPGSSLLLKSRQLAEPEVADDVRRRFAGEGVDPERLLVEGPSSREDYLKAYGRVDMVLDTFPYPGGTTSVDALWMGVPVLTLRGDRFLSRLGQSIAHNAGLEDWIARDAEDYVAKAAAFAGDLPALAALRARLRDQALRSPLFDAKAFAEDFGEALWGMWRARPAP